MIIHQMDELSFIWGHFLLNLDCYSTSFFSYSRTPLYMMQQRIHLFTLVRRFINVLQRLITSPPANVSPLFLPRAIHLLSIHSREVISSAYSHLIPPVVICCHILQRKQIQLAGKGQKSPEFSKICPTWPMFWFGS